MTHTSAGGLCAPDSTKMDVPKKAHFPKSPCYICQKYLLMRATAVIIVFSVFCSGFLQAQHPWSNAVGNAADDLLYTLRVQAEDSLCVFAPGDPKDSLTQAFAGLFQRSLARQHPGVCLSTCPAAFTGVKINAKISPVADGRYKAQPQALHMGNERTWSAVFYVPATAVLPSSSDTAYLFNEAHFSLPELPSSASLIRMSGDSLHGKLLAADGTELIMRLPARSKWGKKRGKTRELAIHKSEVFSVLFETGEWVLYSPDELLGDDLSVDEMRVYLAGEQDASDLYNSKPTALVGFIFGAGAAVLASGGLFLTILPPLAYTGAQFLPVIRIREHTIRKPEHRFNDLYADGYGRVARSRKFLAGLKGSVIGTVAGVAVYYALIR